MYYPMLKKFFDGFFEGDFPGKGKEVFNRHYAEVRSLVPKENLLEFRVQDGWEPLCKFLDQPVPKGSPFPNVNDNSDFVTRSRRRNRNQMYNVALRYVTMLVMGLLFVYAVAHLCATSKHGTLALRVMDEDEYAFELTRA